MADNVDITPGTGVTVRADDVGGKLLQLMRLDAGPDGAETVIRAGQQAAASSLPVVLASDQSPLPVATHGVTQSGAWTMSLGAALPAGGNNIGDVDVASLPGSYGEDSTHASGSAGLFVLGVRKDVAGTLVDTDGDYAPLQMTAQGRLRVASAPADQAATSGSITASGQAVAADVSTTSNVMVQVAGSYTGFNGIFEGTVDGTNWFVVQAVRSDSNTIETATGALSNTLRAWELSVNGLAQLRLRATAFTSGTAGVTISPAPFATEPIPAIQTHPVTQSGSWAVSLSSTQVIIPIPATTQGYATYHKLIAAATTNATSVKTSAASIGTLLLTNVSATFKWFKLYNKASAPVVGTDVPVLTIGVPPGATISADLPAMGLRVATGLAYAITGAAADADTTAVAAGDVIVNLVYL